MQLIIGYMLTALIFGGIGFVIGSITIGGGGAIYGALVGLLSGIYLKMEVSKKKR
ncbi:hypothetical protein [Photobacterium leiognathi]|uniref:hypothetical protein n=1 Tax=Photobacterium leiognathi TaxID=553611 RepID=UPI0027396466|nr:hypothetical protein [Photobacterium leiognathi]